MCGAFAVLAQTAWVEFWDYWNSATEGSPNVSRWLVLGLNFGRYSNHVNSIFRTQYSWVGCCRPRDFAHEKQAIPKLRRLSIVEFWVFVASYLEQCVPIFRYSGMIRGLHSVKSVVSKFDYYNVIYTNVQIYYWPVCE